MAPRTTANGKPCGNSHIPKNATCTKGGGGKKALAAGALAVGAGAALAYSLKRKSKTPALPGSITPRALKAGTTPKLPGSSPKGLLKAAPPKKSKTQRMKENTAAKMKEAEGAIGNAARQEIKRMGAVGNAMASAGEATGMQVKMTARNLRLRTEAARRKFEPGYKKGKKKPASLAEGKGFGLPKSMLKQREFADAIDALTAAHFRDDAFIGNGKQKCGPTSKPCGNACIPKKHKCRASWNKPVKAAATAATIATVGIGATALFHPRARARQAARGLAEPVMHTGFGLGNMASGNGAAATKNFWNASQASRSVVKNARSLAEEYGTDIRNAGRRIHNIYFKMANHRRAKGGRVPGLHYDSMNLTPGVVLDACWKGYVQKGVKRKGNRTVPNCVPVGQAKGEAKRKAGLDGEDKMTSTKRSVWADGFV